MAETLENDEFEDELPAAGAEAESAPSRLSDTSAQAQDTKDKEETFVDIAGYLSKYNPPSVRQRQDMLNDRFVIRPLQEIQQFSSQFAEACDVTDETQSDTAYYALILNRDMPYRMKNMKEQLKMEHGNLLQLAAFGSVQFSENEQFRQVAVVERPVGRRMREVLENRKNPFTERFLIEEIIIPITSILRDFQAAGITHGCINLDTVFLGDYVQLGECFSQPSGYAQHYHFESVERGQASPLGKGEPGIANDCYALGILVAHMILGGRYFERFDKNTYNEKRLVLGTYNIILGGHENASLEDFFKGVLNDDPQERWTVEQITAWTGGKKFNLLTPSVLREGQRPYPFLEEDYFNRRALANAFANNWDAAQTNLRTGHLSRWVEVSLHKNDMGEQMRKVMERTGGINSGSERANNELVARSIALLDPEGPARYAGISCFADGLGPILSHAFKLRDHGMIQSIIQMIDFNFFSSGKDPSPTDSATSRRNTAIGSKLPTLNRYLRITAMGFGIERVLYELNPHLPCQSPLLALEDVLTIQDMLEAIDRLGTRKSKGFDYLDNHIAAFIASKIDITKEVKLAELRIIPALAQNPQLIVLYMLAQAQKKAGRPKLKGLSAWAALRVIPLVDNFHSRTIRRKIRNNLKSAARSGEVDRIIEVMAEASLLAEDVKGFQKAVTRFSKQARSIGKLQDQVKLKEKSDHIGIILATIVAYSTFLLTVFLHVKDRF